MVYDASRKHSFSTLQSAVRVCIVMTSVGISMSQPLAPFSYRHLDSNQSSVLVNLKSGHASCPCLSSSDLSPISDIDQVVIETSKQLSPIDFSTYGIGICAEHDRHTLPCQESTDEECNPAISPLPPFCDRSWCQRSWCYIDPDNCKLAFKESSILTTSNRYYSYAACGEMDSFTQDSRLASLVDRTFRVGFNSNSGGWTGAYAIDGKHFGTDSKKWYGPAVDFVTEAAKTGLFRIEFASPPDFLFEKAEEFFSSSLFDACVYATSLGYLDFCVSQYTITASRASSANWFQLHTEPMILVVFEETENSNSFYSYFSHILRPFTRGTWLLILLFIVPVMGALMLMHDLGATGSHYPRANPPTSQQRDIVGQSSRRDSSNDENNNDTTSSLELGVQKEENIQNSAKQNIENTPIYIHLMHAVYESFLALLQQNFNSTAVTPSGKINLLGSSFFVLAIMAIYTANLAAILTQDVIAPTVESIHDAIRAGYNFCGERKSVEAVMDLYGISNRFVPDPMELGGDGKPGFNCKYCESRNRVFDFMKRGHNDPSTYCNAAIVPQEDLELLQSYGLHCDKKKAANLPIYTQTGFPVFDGVSTELISLFLQLKNNGVYVSKLERSRPMDACPITSGEGTSLSVYQLTGVWVITFIFAFLGIIAKFAPTLCVWPISVSQKRIKKDQGNMKKSLKDASTCRVPSSEDNLPDTFAQEK
mmetsp:Transcript_41214/g.60295  ORF Transcript_41214/g.60295 Transcript_41214/m.60295 type:complete len:706 (-) Transcript_41214:81-2198(-)